MVIKFFSIILDVIAIGMYFQAGRHGELDWKSFFLLSRLSHMSLAYDGNSGYFAFSAL